jgi:serine phosphatase RsbU (regulator of sigma subunit)
MRPKLANSAQLAQGLLLESQGRLNEAYGVFGRLLRRTRKPEDLLCLRYLLARTCVASGAGAVQTGRRHLQKALESLRGGTAGFFPLGELWLPLEEQLLLSLDGLLLYYLRQEKEAQRHLRRVLNKIPAEATCLSLRYALAQVHHNLGLCCVKLQQPEDALEHLHRALRLYGEMRLDAALSRAADGLGQLLSTIGRFREARTFIEISLQAKRKLGDLRGEAISAGSLSRTAARGGDLTTALAAAESVLRISHRISDSRGLAAGRVFRGDARRLLAEKVLERAAVIPGTARGQSRVALRHLIAAREDYLTAASASPDVLYRLNASLGLSYVHYYLGEAITAQKEFDLTVRLYRKQQGCYPEVEEGLRELGSLLGGARDTIRTFTRLSQSIRDSVEEQRRVLEMEGAKRFQEKLLPEGGKTIGGVRVDVLFQACSETSGDLYDFFPTGEGRGLAVVGDVMGHGVAAAMLMVPTVMALRAGSAETLEERVAAINDTLVAHAPKGQFVTMCAVSWDGQAGTLRAVSAGHPAPIFIRGDGLVRFVPMVANPPVGIVPSQSYRATDVALSKGDRILLYSDGISETRDADGAFFEDVLVQIIKKEVSRRTRRSAMETSGSPGGLLMRIHQAATAFRGGRPAEDDNTLLLLGI